MVSRGSPLLQIGAVLNIVVTILVVSVVAGDEPTPSAGIAAMVGRLGRLKPGAETDEAVAALARRGDAAVLEICRQLTDGDPDFGMRHSSVRVLKQVNSEDARELLRRMALGELSGGNPSMEGWAAQALIACDAHTGGELLVSTTPGVLLPALDAVKGETIDDKRLALLKKCLANEDAVVSWRAAAVMTAGSNGEFAAEAVDAISEAMTAVAGKSNADSPFPRAGGATFVEMYCGEYSRSLIVARVDNHFLHQLGGRMRGRARDGVVLALAERGDVSVHEQIVKLAEDPDAGFFRAWAALALEQIGTLDDLPLLRKLAKTDPLVREGLLPAPHPVDSRGPTYPVREAAERTVLMLKRKFKGSTSDAIITMLGVSIAAITAWLAVWLVNQRKRTRLMVASSANRIAPG